MTAHPNWLQLHQGNAPLIVSFPHTGCELPADIAGQFVSPWLARRDADWWVHDLYAFAQELGATTVRSTISRSVIDLNRDPSGASLYPGQNTTGLCPLTTFDNQPLYRAGLEPDEAEIARRRDTYFAPYHAALAEQIARLRQRHGAQMFSIRRGSTVSTALTGIRLVKEPRSLLGGDQPSGGIEDGMAQFVGEGGQSQFGRELLAHR